MSNYNNKFALKYFKFVFLNVHKMRGHWDQFEQHATCPTKHKCKSKNQNLPYQHSDLIGLQTIF